MAMLRYVLLCSLFSTLLLHAQSDFRSAWMNADPVPAGSTLGTEGKLAEHTRYLAAATAQNDSLQRLYGLLYLFYDELDVSEFKEATRYLLEAEALATASGKAGWQGAVSYRRGVLCMQTQNNTAALEAYKNAVPHFRQAGDSLGVGMALEQVAGTSSMLADFAQAQAYFAQAFPLIERYGDPHISSVSLSNFGGMLVRQDRPTEALPYLQRALATAEKNNAYDLQATALNNLSEAYYQLNRLDDALAAMNRGMAINRGHGLAENVVGNYMGLANIYEAKGDLPSALLYTNLYYEMHDSLLGARTQLELADLETKYHSEQKELELQKARAQLVASRLKLQQGLGLLALLLLLAGVGVWRWRAQVKSAQETLERNRAALTELTRVLVEKNAQLMVLEEQAARVPVLEPAVPPATEPDVSFYNQRILTEEDWAAYKASFEKAYPGYLHRLRTAFPALSNAEERLTLFIKLNLNTKESAAILGISADSVKKARNRLRKRLELTEEENLDTFIRSFQG